jgi:caffeoyl-CoA O-methyltransferase
MRLWCNLACLSQSKDHDNSLEPNGYRKEGKEERKEKNVPFKLAFKLLWTKKVDKIKKYLSMGIVGLLLVLLGSTIPCYSQVTEKQRVIDEKVKKFLDKMRNRWRDFNVPEADGKILYEIIVQNRYKRALELGTSTGHSAIWIAWALSKTGGKLITIEIDEGRYRQALANFKEAGLSEYIDARLADAHQLVDELPGPFDFIFIDADKDWYTNYAKALIPKLEPGGCITAHNVEEPGLAHRGAYWAGTEEYYKYMKRHPEFETSTHPKSRAGIAISYKKKRNE